MPGNGTRLTLSQQLHALAQGTPEGGWTLGELMEALGARASALLVIVCALPFCAPVTIPGLSTPFGLVIFLLSLRYALGLPPWLPQRLRKVTLPPKGLVKILEAGSRVIGWIERRMRRRWLFLVMPRWKLRMHAVVIMLSALVLMLPLPPVPPFSNTLPALAIVVMAMSTLERDGKGITTGYGIFVGMIIYFALWAKVLAAAFVRIAERLGF
ncbi:MAG: exopolysaccharide biosynthesis protein [Opitutaceae bacterium]|nr:exopolysaccharide biosynthesis protein [Opitutaceae bacterium]